MKAAAHAYTADPRALAPLAAGACDDDRAGRAIYRALTGRDAAEASTDTDHDFDLHVLASIIAVAATEAGPLCQRVGLSQSDLLTVAARWFPRTSFSWPDAEASSGAEDDELVMLRDLLLANTWTGGETGRWLAHMIARRAMEPSHLWEDLGLRSRDELSRLLKRHFAPLAGRNTRGMRWKRFFYRMLCEDDGFVMCTTPVCTDCCDFENCFGAEDGEGRLARRRLEASQTPERTEAPL